MNIELYVNIYNTQTLLQSEKANSLVGIWNYLLANSITSVNIDVKQTNGTVGGISPAAKLSVNFCMGPVNNSLYGIVVGTGETAVSINDFKLETQAVQGTGSGQLVHSTHALTAPTITSNYCKFSISRLFTNSSGAAITITEIGIYGIHGTTYYIIDRTLVTPFSIPDGETRTVQYEFRTTV